MSGSRSGDSSCLFSNIDGRLTIMEELIGPIKNDTERLEDIKHFFTTEEWNDLVPYQRMVYGRLWENYCVMQRLGLSEAKPDFAIKWERRKAASCLPKSSNAAAKISSSLSASSSAALQKETKSISNIKTSRKRHPKVLDPDWTPRFETSLRSSSGSSKTVNATPLSPLVPFKVPFKVPRIKNSSSPGGSMSKFSSKSGRKKKNRPVWPTSKKVKTEKLLLSDDQAAMFKHFRSIGVLEPGPDRIAEIKLERPQCELKRNSSSDSRSPFKIKNVAYGNNNFCKVNEVVNVESNKDYERYDLSKMADSVQEQKICDDSSEYDNSKEKHTDISSGVSLLTSDKGNGKPRITDPNSVIRHFDKDEGRDMDIKIKISGNVIKKGTSHDALENYNYMNSLMEDKSGINERRKSPIEFIISKSSQFEESENYLDPESRKQQDIEIAGKREPEHRYPKRNIQRRRFVRHLGPEDFQKQEGIYCVFCKRKYYTTCLRHPLTLIKNVDLPRDGSVPDRIHKSAPFPLKVTESKLPGAGEGVVTTHELPAGLVFGPYEGAIVPHVTEENETGYGWEVEEDEESGRTVVDASNPSLSNWLAKVNCPNNEEEDNLSEQFMFGNVFYITKKNITSGSELCVYYGDSYAEELGIDKKSDNWKQAGTGKGLAKGNEIFKASPEVGRNKKKGGNMSTCQVELRPTNWGNEKMVVKETGCSTANFSNQKNSGCFFQEDESKLCFDTKESLSNGNGTHTTVVHTKGTSFACEYCLQWKCSNNDIGLLQKHYKTCAEYYKSKQTLSQVDDSCNKQPQKMTNHTMDKPHGCPHCVYRTEQCETLKSHIFVKHTRDKPHACPQCDYRSAHSRDLKKHIRAKHTGDKPLACPHCDYRTVQSGHLKQHIRAIHRGDKPHVCPHCDYRSAYSGALKDHIRAIHTEDKPHECPHCDYRAAECGNLKRHIRVKHTGDKPYVCPHCDYRAAENVSLKRHIMAIHTGDKPYVCPHCDYRTVHSGHLKKHIRAKHTGDKPHVCPHCDYRAALRNNLTLHIRAKHTGNKPHACPPL